MTNHWDIDVGHSAIHFWVRHMVISKVHGRFARWSGAIQLDQQDLTRSSVDVRIDTASIDTQVADRDTHLRSADFLDVAKYPEMTFRSKRIEKVGDGYRVVGDLSLHGVVREVTLEAEFAGVGKDPWGNRARRLLREGVARPPRLRARLERRARDRRRARRREGRDRDRARGREEGRRRVPRGVTRSSIPQSPDSATPQLHPKGKPQ